MDVPSRTPQHSDSLLRLLQVQPHAASNEYWPLQFITSAHTAHSNMGRKRQRIDGPEKEPEKQQIQAPRTNLETLLNHQSHYLISNRICQYLDVSSLCCIVQTCKKLSMLMKDLQSTQWNIDKKLRRFFGSPKLFRQQLAKFDAVVAGSFAVQYFDRVLWKKADLDIFLEYGEGYGDEGKKPAQFGQYLVGSEGYVLSKKPELGKRYFERLSTFVDLVGVRIP